MSDLTGHEVIDQANDNGVWNVEPAVATGAVVGIVGAVASILVIGGYIDESAANQLKTQAGVIVPALFIIVGILNGLITRLRTYSPRTAAKIAVENAKSTTIVPTLAPPP